jgi:RNA polymerase sigma factor (sigma-70 family)
VEPSRDDNPQATSRGARPFLTQEEPLQTLDLLCSRALSGDGEAEARLYENLRVSLLRVAQRRVRSDDVEDVLQEALRVIHLKLRARPHPNGVLPWSMAVLRNIVGSYYRERSRRDRRVDVAAEGCVTPAPDETMERAEEMDRLSRALDLLSRSNPRCGAVYLEILRSLDQAGGAPGGSTGTMDLLLRRFPGMTHGNFYVTLHRCRARLRKIVEELERGVEHRPGRGTEREAEGVMEPERRTNRGTERGTRR